VQVEQHPVQFFTAVCYEWFSLLDTPQAKEIVIESLRYRVNKGQVKVAAFVIMPNHIHIIWRIQNGYELEDVQRDFLKYTAKGLLTLIKNSKGEGGLESLFVGLKDRKFQVWKRNSMSIDLIQAWFFKQKLDYLHANPCQPHWQLTEQPEYYRYSSAKFYQTGIDEFGFMTHHNEI
jgi:REP element-mobilizing transposase RayT